MANLERHWDELQNSRKRDFKLSSEETKATNAIAILLREDFAESVRMVEFRLKSKGSSDSLPQDAKQLFIDWIKQSSQWSSELESEIEHGRYAEASVIMKKLEAACQTCHDRFRN